MSPSRLLLVACAAAGLAVPGVALAQADPDSTSEDGVRVERDVVIEDDGVRRRVRPHRFSSGRWRVPADSLRGGHDVIRFRHLGPDGAFDLDLPDVRPFDLAFDPLFDDGPLGMRGMEPEMRRELMDLERQAAELAARARRADSAERQEAERELDDVLGRLFDARGRARAERAEEMERRADELRREAEALREGAEERRREREALIERRKRELLGDDASDW